MTTQRKNRNTIFTQSEKQLAADARKVLRRAERLDAEHEKLVAEMRLVKRLLRQSGNSQGSRS
jgi:hypothetical protein